MYRRLLVSLAFWRRPPRRAVGGRGPRPAEGVHRAVQRQGPLRLARLGHPREGRRARTTWRSSVPRSATKKVAAWTADAEEALDGRERRTGQRRPRGVPRHRQGLRRRRAADRVQDGAEGRQRHLPAGHPAGADLGHEPRKASKYGTASRQGLRRAVQQRHGSPGQRPARPRRQAVRRVEHASASSRSASGPRCTSTASSSSTTPGWRTTGTARRPLPRRPARSCSRRTAARSAGGTSSSARSRRPRRTRSCASTARTGSRPCSTARTSTGWAGAAGELRGGGRRDRLQAEEGREHLHQGAVRGLRRPAGVQAAAGRQQRAGDPLPRRRAHAAVRRDVRDADPRRHRREVRQARPAAVQRLGLRHGRGPPRLPAAGRRVELHGGDGEGADDPGGAERHPHPRRRPEQGDGVHGQAPHPGKDRPRGTSGSPATPTRSRSATSGSRA